MRAFLSFIIFQDIGYRLKYKNDILLNSGHNPEGKRR